MITRLQTKIDNVGVLFVTQCTHFLYTRNFNLRSFVAPEIPYEEKPAFIINLPHEMINQLNFNRTDPRLC